jgi:hypothetical protein
LATINSYRKFCTTLRYQRQAIEIGISGKILKIILHHYGANVILWGFKTKKTPGRFDPGSYSPKTVAINRQRLNAVVHLKFNRVS